MVLSFNNTTSHFLLILGHSFSFQMVNIDFSELDRQNFSTAKILDLFLMFIDSHLTYLNPTHPKIKS